jgi:hypothetical protein
VIARGGIRSAAGALALALASGCVRAPPPDLSRNPAPLLAQVRAAQGGISSCRGSARLGLSSPALSGSLDAWVAAEKSGRLRFEVFDFFGNPAAVLVAGGGRFALLDARAGILYRGDDTPENLARLLPVPLGAADLASLVCGGVPILDGQAVTAEPGDGVVLLEVAGEAGRQVLAVGEAASIVSASFLPGARGGTAWKAAFSTFRHPGGRRFPTEVELRGGGAELSLRWKDDLEVNGRPEDALFALDPPRGVRTIDLAPGAPPPPLDLPIRPATPSRP